MLLLKILLLPFSGLYWIATVVRNYLYDHGIRRSFQFEVKTICVGNLSVGGTGKTPMVEYLVRLLASEFKLAILSRGYGRKTKGFILADQQSNARTIGDEPYQYYTKFDDSVVVAVGEERALAIPSILLEAPETELILLDDAFQHRTVICDINILMTDYNHIFYEDMLMPSGRLRESRKGARRADVVIVSKCPEHFDEQSRKSIERSVGKYTRENVPVYFSRISYGVPIKFGSADKELIGKNLFLFTGIARPEPLVEHIVKHYNLIRFKKFSDHHSFTREDLEKLKTDFEAITSDEKCMLTTEKDMVRLKELPHAEVLAGLPLFYLPIEAVFSENLGFDEYLLKALRKNNN